MSKDYSTLVEMGISTKEEALRCYCSSGDVFYPRHPDYVVDSMVKGFKKYWKGESSLKELAEACYLRDIDGLFHYFYQWLNDEDVGE